MNFLGNWTPKQIEHMKREVTEHYADKNKSVPNDFKKFSVSIKADDIDMLKDAVISISEEREQMSGFVNDICFTIETKYQLFYNLDENNWDKIA